jgi:hypothetical protein
LARNLYLRRGTALQVNSVQKRHLGTVVEEQYDKWDAAVPAALCTGFAMGREKAQASW